ncbi:MAG: flagellar hook-basal body complex protein FliE [Oscillospiraceae bacterium]|nr:flagellar hook-basal body complex protein FliE [Oscillospiraceae bacterium]
MAIGFVNPYISNNFQLMPTVVTAGTPTLQATPILGSSVPEKPSFSNFLAEALGETVSTDAGVKAADLGLITGAGDQDVHDVTIAATKADVMLNLTVQIRNRMVEGYQEIMRMQI